MSGWLSLTELTKSCAVPCLLESWCVPYEMPPFASPGETLPGSPPPGADSYLALSEPSSPSGTAPAFFLSAGAGAVAASGFWGLAASVGDDEGLGPCESAAGLDEWESPAGLGEWASAAG